MWPLEFANQNAKKYGDTFDSRRRNFAKQNGEPKFALGELVEFQVSEEIFRGPVIRIKIEWELESWVYDIDAEVEVPYRTEVPECAICPIDAIERLAAIKT